MSGSNAPVAGFLVLISMSICFLIGWITRSEFMIIGIIVWVCLWLMNEHIDLLRMHDVHVHDFFAMNRHVPVPMITLAVEDQK